MIAAGATVHGPCSIGAACQIGPGARIGDIGFGYQWTDDGWVRQEHPFGVVIGDRVDIGANTVINRGRWRDTVIGDGTKIDAQVFVAHNVHVGRNCLLIAQASLAGSVTVGDDAIIGIGATVKQGVTIGAEAIVGAGAVVVHDVPDGEVWAGNPARKLRVRHEGETV